MINSIVIPEGSVICDTDIWVYVCLANIHESFIQAHPYLFFSDVVEGEIMKWKSNAEYSKIAINFEKYKKLGKIKVIQHEIHIPHDERKVLEKILFDLGFENDFKNRPNEDNKGEFVSAIYADHFDIPVLKTNDNAFSENGRGRDAFPDLVVHNWQDVTENLFSANYKMKFRVRKNAETEAKRMKELNKQYKQSKAPIKKVTEENMNEMLAEWCESFKK